MNLEDLQSARNRERRTDSLQPLPNSFYDDAAAFVRELRARRDEVAAAADDPFDSPDVRRLTNSIKTAENTVEAIYERRVGKVVKLASLDAAGMTTDDDGLTPEERDLFGTLTEAIERNRRDVIEGLGTTDDGDEPAETGGGDTATATEPTVGTDEPETENPEAAASTPSVAAARGTGAARATDETSSDDAPTPPPDDGAREAMSAADVMGAPAGTAGTDGSTGGDPAEASPDTDAAVPGTTDRGTAEPAATDSESTDRGSSEADRETIRITRDVGEIVGIDERVYDLASEDVVTLPAANAKPLVDRNAAERLE